MQLHDTPSTAVAPASSTCAASAAHAPAAEESSAVNNEPKDVHELEASQAIIQFIGRFEEFRANMDKVGGGEGGLLAMVMSLMTKKYHVMKQVLLKCKHRSYYTKMCKRLYVRLEGMLPHL